MSGGTPLARAASARLSFTPSYVSIYLMRELLEETRSRLGNSGTVRLEIVDHRTVRVHRWRNTFKDGGRVGLRRSMASGYERCSEECAGFMFDLDQCANLAALGSHFEATDCYEWRWVEVPARGSLPATWYLELEYPADAELREEYIPRCRVAA